MPKLLKQSQTAQPLLFLLVSSTDHIAGLTGATPTVTISKNGAAFASPSGAVTELANGWYKVAGNATDAGTLGPLLIHATATGADPCDERYDVVAFDPQSATNLGLTSLPSTGTLAVNPTLNATQAFNNTGQTTKYAATLAATDVTGNVPADLQTIKAQAVTAAAGVTFPTSIGTSTYAGGAVASVTGSVGSIAAGGITAGSFATDAIGATAVSAAAVTKIQSGLSTYAGGDTSGTTTLLARLTSTRATGLDNLDAAVSTRLATTGYTAPTTPPTVAQIRTEMDANSTKLAQLAGAFTGSTSVFTTASLVNAPSGSGSSPTTIAAAVWACIAVNTTTYGQIMVAAAAVNCGNLTESADHTTSSLADINDPATPRMTSTNTATTRTVTVH